MWGYSDSVAAGTTPQVFVYCYQSGSVTLALYDRPAAPATFSGVASSSASGYLPFSAVGAGQYVADVTLNQGAIVVDNATVASSEEISLGSLSAGDHDIPIYGLSGPPASYSITIRELPVEISGLTFGSGYGSPPTYAAPGTILTGSFSVSGDTTISAYVRNSAGQIVRHLGSFAVSQGSSSITWDTRGDGGASLPDGTYYLHLDSTDPNGNVTSAETAITLDGTPPSAVMISPNQISPSQAISFDVSDAGSGVAEISLIVDGQEVVGYGNSLVTGYATSLPPANGQFSYSPQSSYSEPWTVGSHTWEIQATDNVGNSTDVSGTFVVANPSPPAPPSPPPCGKPKPAIPSGVFAAGFFSPFAHRPSTLALWVSDALIHLQWTGWGGQVAIGVGRETTHSHGHYTSHPAKVQLSNIAVCGGRRVYTHVRYHVLGHRWTTGHRNGCRLSA